MVGLTEPALPPPGGLGFSVAHQKVELEIDFANQTMKGRTELTINPHHKDLKAIRLNCRQCVLTRLNINGRGAILKYQEPYSRFKIHPLAGVHQHHQLRPQLEPQLKEPPEEELLVHLPKTVRIEELKSFPWDSQMPAASKGSGALARSDSGDLAGQAATPTPKTADDLTARYAPLTMKIEFRIDKIRDGLQFVGCEAADPRYPHAYSRHSPAPGSACCLFPCVDSLSSRCTWEISIKCPRTVGDIARRARKSAVLASTTELVGTVANGVERGGDSDFNHTSRPSDEDSTLDMSVICSGDLTDEACTSLYGLCSCIILTLTLHRLLILLIHR